MNESTLYERENVMQTISSFMKSYNNSIDKFISNSLHLILDLNIHYPSGINRDGPLAWTYLRGSLIF